MKRKMLVSIIAVALILAIGTVSVYAMQCEKYSYFTAGYLYVKTTGHLGANADSTNTYINSVGAVVRADHNGGEAMTEVNLTIKIYDQNGQSLSSASANSVAIGGYLNEKLYAADLEDKNVTSVKAKYTVYGYNSRAGDYVYFNPADITINVDECEQ